MADKDLPSSSDDADKSGPVAQTPPPPDFVIEPEEASKDAEDKAPVDEPQAEIIPPAASASGPETSTGGGSGGGGTGYTPGTDPNAGPGPQPSIEPENDLGNIWLRLAYMVGYGIVAWFTFYLLLFLAVLQFIVAVVNKEFNEDLRGFSHRVTLYLKELLAFETFQTEDKPFPFGPFPKGSSED